MLFCDRGRKTRRRGKTPAAAAVEPAGGGGGGGNSAHGDSGLEDSDKVECADDAFGERRHT